MDEPEGQRLRLSTDDLASLTSSLAEPINLEDSHYAQLRVDLERDSRGLEAESWSVAVDQNYLMSLNKEAVKRQDVIYELIQTEMHHVRVIKILFHIYGYELKQSQLVDEAWMEKLFPGVEVLLSLHQHFLNSLKYRQMESQDEENPNNYYITQLGDILINQFSGNLGEQMMEAYSYFCSHHSEVVQFYKEQIQNNKKLQILIRKVDQLPLVRRLTVPECFLLVTQRITKYPVLLERIIQNTDADTEECRSLEKALELIKSTLTYVNSYVRECEKAARIREISYRLEMKGPIEVDKGRWFRKEELIQGNKTLLHEGALTWKSSGKQKEIYAVLVSDMLLLLQEKDQKFVFSSLDANPPVIHLQRVIVREMAHEEKGMYIICACASGLGKMYELHSSSVEECQTWMNLIRDAVNSSRENEIHSKLIAKLQHFQVLLQQRDEQIKQSLEEKQQIFAALYNDVVGEENPYKGLLLRGDASDLQQGEALLTGAIDEVEKLQNLLFMSLKHPDVPVEEEEEEEEEEETEMQQMSSDDDSVEVAESIPSSCDHLLKKMSISEDLEESAVDGSEIHPNLHRGSSSSDLLWTQVLHSVQSLTQKLNSLQAVIPQQDSKIQLQKAFQSKSKLPVRSNSSVLLEQEKLRNLEKQKEELAKLKKQQAQHQAELQRWEKDKETRRLEFEGQEDELKKRQEECRKQEEKLNELWESYQRDLERLRETTQKLDKEKELVNREKERLDKLRFMSISNYDDPTQSPTLSAFPSFRSSIVNGGGTLTPRSSTISLTGSFLDPGDAPPKVPPRRQSISPQSQRQKMPVKLISSTSHVQRPAEVQQKIPKKLAAEPKGKEKTLKSKRNHKRAHSAANIDVSQVVPIRVTGKDGGSLSSRMANAPRKVLSSETFSQPGPRPNVKPSQSFMVPKWNDCSTLPPPPPPFPKDIVKSDQDKMTVL
uniref:Rho/rac guanine nucleotide exchange factor (GEF) 18a n=1 Tax=Fundulus heteroclitus TaxID=8078 RepID=A0A3Q2P8D0_FUNHE